MKEKNSDKGTLNKKSKKHISIIFWIILIVLAYIAYLYIDSTIKYQKAKKIKENQFSNIESQIYQTKQTVIDEDIPTIINDSDPKDILLKQQMQISELQNNYNKLSIEIKRLKTADSLPKIILTFVNLRELIEENSDYKEELRKLEVLCGRDIALSNKIAQLKLFLNSQPKNSSQISEEFSKLIPKIIAKKIELSNNKSWWGKAKASLSHFITIRRTDGVAKNNAQNIDLIIMESKKLIAQKKYGKTLSKLNSLEDALKDEYQTILTKLIFDLENAHGLQKTSDDIYQYLKLLSNRN
jgi:Ca2+/Na+ antiporter